MGVMNTLLEHWLDAEGVAGSALAERIGVTPQHFSKIRRGRITVSLEIAARIEAATRGEVPAVSWLNVAAGSRPNHPTNALARGGAA